MSLRDSKLTPTKRKCFASQYVFKLLFSCFTSVYSDVLVQELFLGSFSPHALLSTFCGCFLICPAIVEVIDCTECGERRKSVLFSFALSLIQNLFLFDVPCVSKGFITAQLCEIISVFHQLLSSLRHPENILPNLMHGQHCRNILPQFVNIFITRYQSFKNNLGHLT